MYRHCHVDVAMADATHVKVPESVSTYFGANHARFVVKIRQRASGVQKKASGVQKKSTAPWLEKSRESRVTHPPTHHNKK